VIPRSHSISPDLIERLARLLGSTSRTFAVSIPLLPVVLRDEVMVAYLLFRMADTIEDEADWPENEKAGALRLLARVLREGAGRGLPELVGVFGECVVDDPGYAALMADAGGVIEAFMLLDDASRTIIARHLARTAEGMAAQVESGRPPRTIHGAREYCYAVAGIVGEMLTELFVADGAALAGRSAELMRLAPAFGEGLQLVNILRDEASDEASGRRYIPDPEDRPALVALAREDLVLGMEYVAILESGGADPGVVAFNALNLLLAFDTLALIEVEGAGAKVNREGVEVLVRDLRGRVRGSEPITPLLRARRARAQSC